MNDDVKLRLWGPHPLHWLAVRERDEARAEVERLREALCEASVSCSETRNALEAEVEQLRGALRDMTPEHPYDIDQDCEWCGSRIYQPHRPGCEWANARAAIDG